MITESRVSYGGVETRVLSVAGQGFPILLLHGYADSADTWRGMLTSFEAADRAAFAVDLPGFGLADPRRLGPITPQLNDFVDAIIAEHGPLVLVGNSLGAATALHATSRDSDGRVTAVITLDEPILARHWLARLGRRYEYTLFFRIVAALPVPAAAVRWAVRRAVTRFMYGPGHPATPEFLATAIRSVPDMPGVAAAGRDAVRYAREHPAGHPPLSLDCPALVIHGAKDAVIPVAAAHQLHTLLPGSELMVLPGVGHCPQLDVPIDITRRILDFLHRGAARDNAAS